jgi:hypothetical protein
LVISFQKASQAAVSMHDPWGEINFEVCEFTMNEAASMVIDGRYEGTPGAPVGAQLEVLLLSVAVLPLEMEAGIQNQMILCCNSTKRIDPFTCNCQASPNPDSPDLPTTPCIQPLLSCEFSCHGTTP